MKGFNKLNFKTFVAGRSFVTYEKDNKYYIRAVTPDNKIPLTEITKPEFNGYFYTSETKKEN